MDHVKPLLNAALHVIDVVQHDSQRVIHALQFAHQVSVVLRGLVLVLQELQHAVVCSAAEEKGRESTHLTTVLTSLNT